MVNSGTFIIESLLAAVNPSLTVKQFKGNTITCSIQIVSVFSIFTWKLSEDGWELGAGALMLLWNPSGYVELLFLEPNSSYDPCQCQKIPKANNFIFCKFVLQKVGKKWSMSHKMSKKEIVIQSEVKNV